MRHLHLWFIAGLFLLSACSPLTEPPVISDQGRQQFSTSEEITAFLQEHQQQSGAYGSGPLLMARVGGMEEDAAPSMQKATAETVANEGEKRYSQTNVQVVGVDEADIVKNDGKYIYTLTQNKLVIVDAYPPNTASITATLEIPGNPRDLFINQNRLLVFTDLYQPVYTIMQDVAPAEKIASPSIVPPERYQPPKTGVLIYDTTNKEDPELLANYTVEGNYYQSRMINEYVYVVAQNPAYYGGGPVPLPALRTEDKVVMESPVYYFDNWEPQITFNSIASFNLFDVEDVNLQTFMLGYANTLYVSNKNMYIAYQ
ncbi:beta-propeller domain-containing protein, partial [Candidatus Woesearchaeota archaeon]|nr:beta-propeller domain-containing protein [Candidatus Woesearchaeota archaeon]